MKPTFFRTAADFRAWLERHHASARELLVGFRKKGTGKPSITWPESVDQALCFGWIDGVRRSIDDESYTIRFTPRTATSRWSAVNIARVEALIALGQMTPAGLAAYAGRREDRTRTYSYEQGEGPVFEPALEKIFRAQRKAWAFFEARSPSYRRKVVHWIASAKRPETRRARLDRAIEAFGRGETL